MSHSSTTKYLLYGYGNIGRQDDGLGVKIVKKFEDENQDKENISCDSNYQLNIEDALTISNYDVVVFIDASLNSSLPFEIKQLSPAQEISFSTHEMLPTSVLALCDDMFKKKPETFLMTIPGYEWEMGESLSPQASINFTKAYHFLVNSSQNNDLLSHLKNKIVSDT